MSIAADILSSVLRFALEVVVELIIVHLLHWIGECTLWFITFGKHKPEWEVPISYDGHAWTGSPSVWVGVATVLAIGFGIATALGVFTSV